MAPAVEELIYVETTNSSAIVYTITGDYILALSGFNTPSAVYAMRAEVNNPSEVDDVYFLWEKDNQGMWDFEWSGAVLGPDYSLASSGISDPTLFTVGDVYRVTAIPRKGGVGGTSLTLILTILA